MSACVDNATTMDWLQEWARPHRRGYIAAVLAAVAGVICALVPYFAVSRIVVGLMAGERDMAFYWRWLAVTALFWLLRVGLHGLSTVLSHRATFAVIATVRPRLVRKLARIPMGRVLDTPSGVFKNTIVEKVDSIEPTLSHVLPEMTANALVPLAIVAYLFRLDWRMALASLATLPLTILCYRMMTRNYEARYRNYVDTNRRLNATAVEYIGGIEVIKAFNQSAASYEKFAVAAREAAASAIDWMRSSQVYFSIALAVFPATLVAVLPAGGYFFMDGSLSREDLVQAVILSIGIAPPLLTAMSYSDDLAKVGTIVRDIAAVLSLPELERPAERAAIDGHAIEFRGVSFGYGDRRVLDNVDLTIEPGSVTALVGPSGGGKSTIAKLIASLWDVDDGRVVIGCRDIRDIPLEQLNAMVASVAQDNYLFNDTVRNNIRMGRPGAPTAGEGGGAHAGRRAPV
ncbi:MAG: ABC transporter ATP-binding protein/permease [Planctomycetes bacterium]|nr:ABC transporter ATP-binding protein/permease [Planctomycetota bacterium]